MKSEWRKEMERYNLQTKVIGVVGIIYFVVLLVVANQLGIQLQ